MLLHAVELPDVSTLVSTLPVNVDGHRRGTARQSTRNACRIAVPPVVVADTVSAVNSTKYPLSPPEQTVAPLACGAVKFAVMLPDTTAVGVIVSRAPASVNTNTVDVVMPLVLARLTVRTPGAGTALVLVVMTAETGQLVSLPAKTHGAEPG